MGTRGDGVEVLDAYPRPNCGHLAALAEVRSDEAPRIRAAAIQYEPDLATLLEEERAAKRRELALETLQESRKTRSAYENS